MIGILNHYTINVCEAKRNNQLVDGDMRSTRFRKRIKCIIRKKVVEIVRIEINNASFSILKNID